MESRVRTTGSFDVGNGPVKQPADLQSLTSFEYAMVHEWRHADVFGPSTTSTILWATSLADLMDFKCMAQAIVVSGHGYNLGLIIGREYRGAVQKELP
jgi:hypothetical protein